MQLTLTLQSGDRSLLWDDQGNEYWDFYGGHAVTLIGNSHPKLTEAISKQACNCPFVPRFQIWGFVKLQHKLLDTGTDVAWFVNSGAEANEGALKMARAYGKTSYLVAMVKGFWSYDGCSWCYMEISRNTLSNSWRYSICSTFGDAAAIDGSMDDDTVAAVIVGTDSRSIRELLNLRGYLQEVAEKSVKPMGAC